jgi:hypothetical protein
MIPFNSIGRKIPALPGDVNNKVKVEVLAKSVRIQSPHALCYIINRGRWAETVFFGGKGL